MSRPDEDEDRASAVVDQRERMAKYHLAARGISDVRVLDAFRSVPREAFVSADLAEFAYDDTPLPIEAGQTISQPYIVAVTVEALQLQGHERVLEIGTGSGYAAAILARLASAVFSVERHESLAIAARERLARLGFANVEVLHADGTLGWPERAPFDAIAVAAGGPEVPEALQSQLAIGGRLVIPVGADVSSQVLVRVTRTGPTRFERESLGAVRFVPLIGAQGWAETPSSIVPSAGRSGGASAISTLVREVAEPIEDLESTTIDALLERIGDSRVVLLGESSHGTSEFYRMRARITRALIERLGFDFVAVEADWPDAARIDDHVVGGQPRARRDFVPFARFPTWMWRNHDVDAFVAWLRARNFALDDPSRRVGFHGLDLYSLFTSIAAVLGYLEEVDPDAANVARERYGVLTPWQKDPAAYGHAVLVGRYESAEHQVVQMLREMLARRLDYARQDGDRFFDAAQNARVVANAERYYRAMYYGAAASWNLRDEHMFDTLQSLFAFYGPSSRGIVWAHNSHVGNAAATEMSARGEHNIGQLCRARYDRAAYVIGFGTDHGTVAAASRWDAPMQTMRVRPSHPESYERLFHDASVPAFSLHLRDPKRAAIREELLAPRLERAIGVIYRPERELASHYFQACLPVQFDELVWFDETSAVRPLVAGGGRVAALPESHPFGG